MTKQRFMRFGDLFMLAVCFLGIAWGVGAYGISARYWFDPQTVYVADSVTGEAVVLVVDREIKRPFKGSYTATVRALNSATVICDASGALNYDPKSSLPDPVTLAWWAYSDARCHGPNLPAGEYVLTTTWTIKSPFRVLPDKSVSVISNPFRIEATSPSIIKDQQMQIETLQRSVDELRTKVGE